MKEAKHILINEAKWDEWADTLDEKGKRNDYLRKAQSDVIALLEMNENTHLLDIGCGTGKALAFAAEKNSGKGEFYGVDLSEKMIEKAKENFRGKENFHFIQANAEFIPLPDHSFDDIICTHSFHHYLHPIQALKEMHRLLKPAGKLYLLDPTTDGIMMKVIDKIVKLTDKAHVKMYSTKEFKNMFSVTGFQYLDNQVVMGPVKVHIGRK